MMGNMLLMTAMNRQPTDVTAAVPKMWVDVAARIMGVPYLDVLRDPALATRTIVAAARRIGADGARLLLFPQRRIEMNGDKYEHRAADGRLIGEIDFLGGWGTRLQDNRDFCLENPDQIAHFQLWHSSTPLVRDLEDVRRICIPDADYYEKAGYGATVATALAEAGDAVGCIGDCNSGTLSFQVALRGMDNALLDLLDEPEMTAAIMDKGIAMALERARFFARRGVRILRYNDSTANMSVISPALWREYILPRLREFCTQAHRLAPDVRIYCHICGNILPIAADLAASGLDCIAPLDPLGGFTVGQIRSIVGQGTVLMGGVNTLSFLNSSEQEIAAEARRCIREGRQGGSFVLGSGCVLPRQTRLENLQAMIRTAHEPES